jgi:hypothetical protein
MRLNFAIPFESDLNSRMKGNMPLSLVDRLRTFEYFRRTLLRRVCMDLGSLKLRVE